MNSTTVATYRSCMRKREAARARGDVKAEDAILEEMDVLWWDMSDAERNQLDLLADLDAASTENKDGAKIS